MANSSLVGIHNLSLSLGPTAAVHHDHANEDQAEHSRSSDGGGEEQDPPSANKRSFENHLGKGGRGIPPRPYPIPSSSSSPFLSDGAPEPFASSLSLSLYPL